jgi:nucleotide-binding universal stress UspA family protein
MTYVVAFDDSRLSREALARARRFAGRVGHDLVAVTVVPAENEEYARERGWLAADEPFDGDAVTAYLEGRARSVAPTVRVRVESVDRFAPEGTIARRLRRTAKDLDAEVVFVGSENAARA